MSGDIHVCIRAKDDCYATMWSYGEICVRCGCCGEPSLGRDMARLRFWQSQLDDNENFNQWADDEKTRRVQEANVKANIREAKREIETYTRLCALQSPDELSALRAEAKRLAGELEAAQTDLIVQVQSTQIIIAELEAAKRERDEVARSLNTADHTVQAQWETILHLEQRLTALQAALPGLCPPTCPARVKIQRLLTGEPEAQP